jgi:hypothetical protein
MTGTLTSLPHIFSRSRGRRKGGHTTARPAHPRVWPMGQPSALSRTALVLQTKLILPLDNPDGRTPVSLLVADTVCATHKSP